MRVPDYGINFPNYGLIAAEQTIANRRDALAKLAKVQVATWEYIWGGHEDEAVAALISARSNIKLDRDVVKGQLMINKPLLDTENTKGKPIGGQSEKDWKHALRDIKASGASSSCHNRH